MWTFDREDVRAKLENLENGKAILIGPKEFETDTLVLEVWSAGDFREAQAKGLSYRSVTIPPQLRPQGTVEVTVELLDGVYYVRHQSIEGAVPWLKDEDQKKAQYPWDSSNTVDGVLKALGSMETCLKMTTIFYTAFHSYTMGLGIHAWAKTMDQMVRDETTQVWAVNQHE